MKKINSDKKVKSRPLLKLKTIKKEDKQSLPSKIKINEDKKSIQQSKPRKMRRYKPNTVTKSFDSRGVIYVGNLPYGFYEETLKEYFSQFGEISRLKVARSKRNAKPMGYAFIQFSFDTVAKVAAEAMDNYLIFGKLLKCKVVPRSKVREIMFKDEELQPEFCRGTKRKRRNQFKTEKVGEKSQKRINRKVSKSLKLVSTALGIDESVAVKAEKSVSGSTLRPSSKDFSLSAWINSELEEEESTGSNSVSGSKKRKLSAKESNLDQPKPRKARMTRLRKKLNISSKEKLVSQRTKKAVKSKKSSETENKRKVKKAKRSTRKIPPSKVVDSPITMEIEEVDEEIIVKTPPNVVKKIKKGKQRVICDDTAPTVSKSIKRTPLNSRILLMRKNSLNNSQGKRLKLELDESITSLDSTKKRQNVGETKEIKSLTKKVSRKSLPACGNSPKSKRHLLRKCTTP